MTKKLLRIKDVAKVTKLSPHTVYTYNAWGLLPKPKMKVGNTLLFSRGDIVRWMKARKR